MSFVSELKRRKVFQVAAVYAVVAWLIIQVVDVVSEPLNLPSWFEAVSIVLLAIGFPIAVIVAWAYDLTSSGVKLDSEAQISDAPIHPPGHRLNFGIQALVLIAVGFLVVDQFFLEPDSSQSAVAPQAGAPRVTRFAQYLPEGQAFSGVGSLMLAVSPDGSSFVFATSDGLYIRSLNMIEPRLIVRTVGRAANPFFSPEGDEIAYMDWVTQQLKRVARENFREARGIEDLSHHRVRIADPQLSTGVR